MTTILDDKRIIDICAAAIDVLPTGSKFICPSVTNNDIDIMLYVDDIINFYEKHKLVPSNQSYGDDKMLACREGIYNILLTENQDYFNKWKFATKLATGLNLVNKQDRVFLFSSIIDKEELHIG